MKILMNVTLAIALTLSFNAFGTTEEQACPAKETCDACRSKCVSADGTPTGHCPKECKPCKGCGPKN